MIGLTNQQVLVKTLFLLIVYMAHGRPFEGLPDYGYALLVAYLLLFGFVRERIKPILAIIGLVFLTLGHFIPQLAIPEQQRLLMDDKSHLIRPSQFLKDTSKYPYFLTADGYLQGHKDKRLVRTIDIDEGLLSLRSGWMNRPEYNFYPPMSPYIRHDLPFVVCYEITPQMVDMTLSVEGVFVLEMPAKQVEILAVPDHAQKLILSLQEEHVGAVLYGFGGQWDESGFHNLKIKLEKTVTYKLYDVARWGSFFLGLGLLFFGLFSIRLIIDFGIQSLLLFLSAVSFWFDYPRIVRWGILAAGGSDGIIHGGFPYWMLEKWATGDWGGALMSPEQVFYFMPGMRYGRFAEMLLFGDAYILQVCLLIFVPVIFYRFFSVFLSRVASFLLTVMSFASLLNGMGLSLKMYTKSMTSLYGEGFAYALLFISLTLLAKSIQKVGWGMVAFFLLAISISIRPNLAVFVGIIGGIHLFTTTFSSLPFSSLPWVSRFMMLCGLVPVILIPLHNILGGEFVLLTKASQIPENLPLSPSLYYQAICYLLGFNETFNRSGRFIVHFQHIYPQYVIAWLGCLFLSFKGQTPVVKTFALATFAGLSVHLFYLPDLRYLHPYLTVAIVLGLSQIPRFRCKRVQPPDQTLLGGDTLVKNSYFRH